MQTLKVAQISGSSNMSFSGQDPVIDLAFEHWGFVPRERHAHIGAVPAPGRSFIVDYDEARRFELRDARSKQTLCFGTATESHQHKGLGTLTFYGKVSRFEGDDDCEISLSFHCEK